MLRRCLLALSALSLLLASACQQPSQICRLRKDAQARIANAELRQHSRPSGHFDYFLFTLSWSPEYCHGHPNNSTVRWRSSGICRARLVAAVQQRSMAIGMFQRAWVIESLQHARHHARSAPDPA